MTGWSGSQFLQALGWATLNSFWQMALLWCVFAVANHFSKMPSTKKYRASVSAMLLGFSWFIATFITYYQSSPTIFSFFENRVTHSNDLLQICLFSASITYLLLLVFPAARLFKNWQFVQRIKKEGQQKAGLEYRLFVQKISTHLNIKKKVRLVVSSLVASPVTIGFLKPAILLPAAVLNSLSTKQVEAILLHELSHIRRYDYLVNFIVSIIHTLLYFNPFAKVFMNIIEAERENCCDEMVLQFGYNKVDYASALLYLQKASTNHSALALGAAGKQNLLNRIEKIVGMEKKKTFKRIQIIPVVAAILCILLFNSILIIKDKKGGLLNVSYAYEQTFLPWQVDIKKSRAITPVTEKQEQSLLQTTTASVPDLITVDIYNLPTTEGIILREETIPSLQEHILPVKFDEVNELTTEEAENIESAVAATKKVVSALHWKEIDASIAEVLSSSEKAVVRHEYQQELEKIDWGNIKRNLKAGYEKLDWNFINENVSKAMAQVQLDSLQTVCSMALTELQKMERELNGKSKSKRSAMPDVSINELKTAKGTLQIQLDSLKSIRHKKVVRL